MTNEEILAYQAKERAFAETAIGKAFIRFKLAHSHYWQADNSDSISDRRMRELHDRAEAAEQELRNLIDPIAFNIGSRR